MEPMDTGGSTRITGNPRTFSTTSLPHDYGQTVDSAPVIWLPAGLDEETFPPELRSYLDGVWDQSCCDRDPEWPLSAYVKPLIG